MSIFSKIDIRMIEEDNMPNNKMTIFIAGDSTAEIKTKSERPESGWGEFLSDFFDASVHIENHAMGGRSTKSYLDQNRFEPILDEMKPGDYLLIQFGHNDQKIEDPERYTDPHSTYQENLKWFVKETRQKNAIPILLTSISRRIFIDGQIDKTALGDYPEAMRKVAQEEDVSLIDMHKQSIQLLNQLGEQKSKDLFLHLEKNEYENYPEGLIDNTHFSEMGAKTFAKMIAQELAKTINEINQNRNKE